MVKIGSIEHRFPLTPMAKGHRRMTMFSVSSSSRSLAHAIALGLMFSFAGCAAQVHYDQTEHLHGLTVHPLAAESYRYTVITMTDGDALILRVEQEGLCRFVEQRVYRRADVPARRMRQRYHTTVLATAGACERKPACRRQVSFAVGGQHHLLGQTDDTGTLRIALNDPRVDLWRRDDDGPSLLIDGNAATPTSAQ